MLNVGYKTHKSLLFVVLLIGISIVSLFILRQFAYKAVEHTLLQSARVMALSVNASRSHYSVTVTNKLGTHPDISVKAEYQDHDLTIPNPATFAIEVAAAISAKEDGFNVRMFSDYPFPNRQSQGGAKTEFEKQSLSHFRDAQHAGGILKPRFSSTIISSGMVFEYIEPIVMETSCVDCHNTLGSSPKKNWKVGDVRGALSITQMMDQNSALTDFENVAIYTILTVSVLWVLLLMYSVQDSRKQILATSEKAMKIANTDPLTGLLNRRGLEQETSLAWEKYKLQQKPLAVIYCDLDKFKQLNDLHGHASGDAHLVQTANVIRSALREGTDFAARVGGDEFVIVLLGASEQDAEMVANRMNKARLDYKNITVIEWSLGVASLIPGDSNSPGELLNAADKAMYAVKQSRSSGTVG